MAGTLDRRIRAWSWDVWNNRSCSSFEGGVGGGLDGAWDGFLDEASRSASAAAAAARAASSIWLTFIRVSSTKARMSSALVARRVLKGNPRVLGSLCRSTCPS